MTLTKKQQEVLKRDRTRYGNAYVMTVAAEECLELAAVLLKYGRKESFKDMRKKVLTERVDVELMLDHIDAAYHFGEREIEQEKERKIKKLENYLNTACKSRCDDCYFLNHFEEAFEKKICEKCSHEYK